MSYISLCELMSKFGNHVSSSAMIKPNFVVKFIEVYDLKKRFGVGELR